MLRRQDMGSQKATVGSLWPHRTRTYTPFISATSPCPPASLSSRSSPWQSPRGSLLCSGTPSVSSPLSRNENGRAVLLLRWLWRGPLCFFHTQSKDRALDSVLETAFGEWMKNRRRCTRLWSSEMQLPPWKGEDGDDPQLWGNKNPLTCAEVAEAWDQWHGSKVNAEQTQQASLMRACWLLRGLRGRARQW